MISKPDPERKPMKGSCWVWRCHRPWKGRQADDALMTTRDHVVLPAASDTIN
ncbi:hypothetical protein [Streptomyces sp. NPDC058644]|uniref:hypothetical protein n=1 Tax=unclassified Streptomyces TaxID=2593676 RepID=UPI00364C1F63